MSPQVLENCPFTSISKNLRYRPNSQNLQISQISRKIDKFWKLISGHLYREISKISIERSRKSRNGLKPRSKYFQNPWMIPLKFWKYFPIFGTKNLPKISGSRNLPKFSKFRSVNGPEVLEKYCPFLSHKLPKILSVPVPKMGPETPKMLDFKISKSRNLPKFWVPKFLGPEILPKFSKILKMSVYVDFRNLRSRPKSQTGP